MCVFLLPLYYMVTKLAEEKESRAREGMKMMGLNDKSYFVAWAIFMMVVITVMSAILTISSARIFTQSNLLLVFLLSITYGMTIYGVSFVITSFLPSKKTSASVASFVHILTFYIAFAFRGSAWSRTIKLMLSIIPNCALLFSV